MYHLNSGYSRCFPVVPSRTMEISGAYLWAGLATGVTPKHVTLKKHQKQVASEVVIFASQVRRQKRLWYFLHIKNLND